MQDYRNTIPIAAVGDLRKCGKGRSSEAHQRCARVELPYHLHSPVP
jgi:hypothetical protein